MICVHLCPSQESANEGWFWHFRVSTGRVVFRVGPAGDAGKVAGDAVSKAQGWERGQGPRNNFSLAAVLALSCFHRKGGFSCWPYW